MQDEGEDLVENNSQSVEDVIDEALIKDNHVNDETSPKEQI